VSAIARKEESLGTGLAGPEEMQGGNRAVGLAFSVILHGLALLWLLVVGPYGTQGSVGGLRIVPVEVELISEDTTPPAERRVAALPQPSLAQQPSFTPTPVDVAPEKTQPLADELETKLQALAKLRQPESVTPSEQNGSGGPNMVATNDDVTSGRQGLYSVKDFILAQVERRWNLDLATLGNNQFSVPIHVEITSGGVVLKAEIVDTARSTDPAYREIAVSARNAVLLSSPLSLPAGHYQGVMDMVLYLNPRDTLR
jgi:hypothetical protein